MRVVFLNSLAQKEFVLLMILKVHYTIKRMRKVSRAYAFHDGDQNDRQSTDMAIISRCNIELISN